MSNISSEPEPPKVIKWHKHRLRRFASGLIKCPELWTKTHEFVPETSWSEERIVNAGKKLCELLEMPLDLHLLRSHYYQFKSCYYDLIQLLVLDKITACKSPPGPHFCREVVKTAQPWLKDFESKYKLMPTVMMNIFEDSRMNNQSRWKCFLIQGMEACCGSKSGLRELAQDIAVPEATLVNTWDQMCLLATHKLQLLLSAGDDPPPRAAVGARMSLLEWRIADLLMLCGQVQLLEEASLVSLESQRPLIVLVHLMRRCGIEARPAPARAVLRRRWMRAHHIYNRYKLRASLVLLQRRWYELKAATRARLLPLCREAGDAPQPLPIHVVVAKCFPHVVTQPMASWRELVETGAIFKPFDHDAVESDENGKKIESNDDDLYNNLKIFDKDSETINIESDDDILVIDDSSNDDVGPNCQQNSAPNNKECTSLDLSRDSRNQHLNVDEGGDLLRILEKVDPKTVLPVIVFSSDSENDQDDELERYDISDINENSDDISEVASKACSDSSANDARSSANSDVDMDTSEHGDKNEECHDIDPKLLMDTVVVLEKLPDNVFTYHDPTHVMNSYRRNLSSNQFQVNRLNPINSEHSYSFRRNRKRTYSPDLHLTHPDFNPKLLNLSPEFLSSDNTLRLLKLCKPVTVDLQKMLDTNVRPNEGVEVAGRVAKKVELPDIEEIRRINKNILTAQVAPIGISANKSMLVLDASGSQSPADATSAAERLEPELPLPTEQELLDAIRRFEAQKQQAASYCCRARRERALHAARLRLATHAGRLYRQVDVHRHSKAKKCKCCCVQLLADDAKRLQSIKEAQRALAACLEELLRALNSHVVQILANDNEEFTNFKSYLASIKTKRETKSKKTKRRKPSKVTTERTNATEHVDEYEEWMRQRHIGSVLYGLKPLEIKTYQKNSSTKTYEKGGTDCTTGVQTSSIAEQQSFDATETSAAPPVASTQSVASSDESQKPKVKSHQNKNLNVEYFRKILEEMTNSELAIQAGLSMNKDDVSLNQSLKNFVMPVTHQETSVVIIKQSAVNENTLSINQFVNQMDAKLNNQAAPAIPGTVQCAQTMNHPVAPSPTGTLVNQTMPVTPRCAQTMNHIVAPSSTSTLVNQTMPEIPICAQTMNHIVAPRPTGTLVNQIMPEIPICAQTMNHIVAPRPTGTLINQTMPEIPMTMNASNAFNSQPLYNKIINNLETTGQTRVSSTDQSFTAFDGILSRDQQMFDPVVKSGPILKPPIVTLMPALSNQVCQPIPLKESNINVHMLTNLMADINTCVPQTETNQNQSSSNVAKATANMFNSTVVTKIRNVIKHAIEQAPMPIITTVHSQYEPAAAESSAPFPWTSKQPPWIPKPTSNPPSLQNTTEETLTESPIPVISDDNSLIDSNSGSLPIITNVSSLPPNEIIDLNDSDDEISEQFNFKQISKAPAVRAAEFVEGRDLNDTTLICLSGVEAPYLLMGDYLVLTNTHINVIKPVYWSIGPRNQSHRIIFDHSESNEMKQSSETNTFQSGNRSPEKEDYDEVKNVDSLSQNIGNLCQSGTNSSQSESNSFQSVNCSIQNQNNRFESGNNTTQSENNISEIENNTNKCENDTSEMKQSGGEDSSQNFKPRLKVKSFAKMLEGNSVVAASEAVSNNSDDVTAQQKHVKVPDVILMLGIKYKKLIDTPVISYAKVLTAMNLKQCHECLLTGRDVYFYSLETGVISPLKRLPIAISNNDTPSGSSSCALDEVPTGTPAGNSGNIANRMCRISLSTDPSAMHVLHDLMSKLLTFQAQRLPTTPSAHRIGK